MIIVRLDGGLGNQLFQYATGRALAVMRSCQLQLDTRSYYAGTGRTFDLFNFKIAAKAASKLTLALYDFDPNGSFARRLLGHAGAILGIQRKIDQMNGYDPNVFETSKALYLKGYWQSEKYF